MADQTATVEIVQPVGLSGLQPQTVSLMRSILPVTALMFAVSGSYIQAAEKDRTVEEAISQTQQIGQLMRQDVETISIIVDGVIKV